MKKYIIFSFSALFILMIASANLVLADGTEGYPSESSLSNPLSINTPQLLIGKVVDSILGVVGSLALLMFVYGGIVWMTSSGNQEKVKKGRDIIVWSAIGLAIIFSAYGLTRVLIEGLVK
jgi:hypothetical protein